MAQLPTDVRRKLWAEYQSDISVAREILGGVSKTTLLDAVTAIDAWLDANAVALNNALPAEARTKLTVAQKARLLTMVVTARWGR